MKVEISHGEAFEPEARMESGHFSAAIFELYGAGYVIEIMPLRRERQGDGQKRLNSSCVFRHTLCSAYQQARQFETSLYLARLEEMVKAGQTAKGALSEIKKLTPEEEKSCREAWDWITKK
jgi:uncharacterized protein (DUF169 family)